FGVAAVQIAVIQCGRVGLHLQEVGKRLGLRVDRLAAIRRRGVDGERSGVGCTVASARGVVPTVAAEAESASRVDAAAASASSHRVDLYAPILAAGPDLVPA